MKILIIDTYYPSFLKSFYAAHPESKILSYKDNKRLLLNQFFGTSDYYSYYLRKLGHQVDDLILNDELMQRKWAKENNLEVSTGSLFSRFQMLPLFHRFLGRPKWVQQIGLAQIKQFHPDVVYMQDLSILNADSLREIKQNGILLVGQIASPLPSRENLKQFDLILTSFPHFVPLFQKMGIASEYFKISFDSRILKIIGKQKKKYDVSFIGSFSPHHLAGTKLLEEVARTIPIHVWGQGLQFLSPMSPLRRNFHGEAWGVNMYRILAQSKIIINRHISVSGNYANNMRLYESTGMGAMLITDNKKNLASLFTLDEEVVAYKNSQTYAGKDLIKKIQYYLQHDKIRVRIALNGQKRTLKDYTYEKRMKELVLILNKYLKKND